MEKKLKITAFLLAMFCVCCGFCSLETNCLSTMDNLKNERDASFYCVNCKREVLRPHYCPNANKPK